MASLVFTSGPNAGRRYPLGGDDLLVGRRSDCHIHIPDVRVSRLHARLWREGSRWLVEDLRSTCGTYVNGDRILRPTVLEAGDELSVAASAIRVELFGATSASGDPELALVDTDHPRVYVSAGTGGAAPGPEDPKRALRLLERKLGALRAILALSGPRTEPSAFFDALTAELLEAFPKACAACVLARDSAAAGLELRSLRRRDSAGGVEVPRVLLDSLAEHSGGVLLDEEMPPRSANGQAEPSGTRMGAPIRGHSEVGGVLYIESHGRDLCRDDVDLLASIAAHVGLVLDSARMHEQLTRRHRLERDLLVARQIQRSLLPPADSPDIPGLDVAIHYAPAYEIGGDFYDTVWHDASRVALVVGDVAGKAISAALYMARLTSELRSRAGGAPGPADLLSRVNDEMCKLGDEGMFATLVYAVYDLERRELVFTNAGHVAPLLRRDGRAMPLHAERAHVPPLGFERGMTMGQARVALRPGDLVLLATDGISEARSAEGREYGIQRLAQRLATAGPRPADVVEELVADVRDHVPSGRQGDDITLMAVSVD